VTKPPNSQSEPESNPVDMPVPNRRERRGSKAGVPSAVRGGKSTEGRSHGAVLNRSQYSTRRRGR
jgi:hypothetical protein